MYVHDSTLASECIWVSSPRNRLRNTADQAMLVRGSARSLISMSRPDKHCHGEGTNLGLIIKTKTKIVSKPQSLQNSNFDAISFQKHFTIIVIFSNCYSFI